MKIDIKKNTDSPEAKKKRNLQNPPSQNKKNSQKMRIADIFCL